MKLKHLLFRLLTDLTGWTHGIESVLPFTVREQCLVIDPQPDPALRMRGRWPDAWFCYSQGIDFTRVEACEIVALGLHGAGTVTVDSIEACREHHLSGPWHPLITAGHSLQPGFPLTYDATLELIPLANGDIRADLTTLTGGLEWSWDYSAVEAPFLSPGANTLTISGLPPQARVDIRVDRILQTAE